MPIPSPATDETQSTFVARCMADAVMVSDYPRVDQRYAVCLYTYVHRNNSQRIEGLVTASEHGAE